MGLDIKEAIMEGLRVGETSCSPAWGRHLCGRSDMFEQVLVRFHRKEDHYQAILQAISFRCHEPAKTFTQTYMDQILVKSADLSDASKDYVMRMVEHHITTRIDPSLNGMFVRWDHGATPNEIWLRPNPDYVEPPEFRTLPPL